MYSGLIVKNAKWFERSESEDPMGMTEICFSTEGLNPAHRLGSYEHALENYVARFGGEVAVHVHSCAPDRFTARMESYAVADLPVFVHTYTSDCHRYISYTKTQAAGLFFYLLIRGDMTLSSDDGQVRLRPGGMAFFRPCREAEFRSSDGNTEILALYLSPALLRSRSVQAAEFCLDRGFGDSGGVGAYLPKLIQTTRHTHAALSTRDAAFVGSMIADSLVHLGTSQTDSGCAGARQRLGELKKLALSVLDDPDLDPAMIADLAGCSVRTLHRLFSMEGDSFGSWLRAQRLERCFSDLERPISRPPSVMSVAMRWGFNDLTTFNRSFRSRFGVTPGTVRRRTA
jgi:AraC-like DNA-binding protein